MKPEEAIEILELPKEPLKSGTHYHAIPSSKRISYTEYLNARKAAVEALEKQVEKKGKVFFGGWLDCPSCENDISGFEERPNYCPDCGQKINWEETP